MTHIDKAIASYLDTVEIGRAHNTFLTYRQALREFASMFPEETELTAVEYERFLHKTKEASPATRSLQSTAIIGLFEFLAETSEEYGIQLAQVRRLRKRYLRKPGKRIVRFDRDSIEQMIRFVDGNTMRNELEDLRNRAFILVLADTGARISEACSLRRGDLDWKEARAVIIGKGDKQAVLRFTERSLSALKLYLDARAGLDGATGRPLASLPLFARHDKRAEKQVRSIDSGSMWKAVKRVARQAGVDPQSFRVHDFRHYFITVAMLASGDIKLVQELARHSRPETTSRYAHYDGRVDQMFDEIFNRKERKV